MEGLLKGLVLDASNSVITGVVPSEKGDYVLVVKAKNRYREITREFKLVVGDKIALTPPTGWNSWCGI